MTPGNFNKAATISVCLLIALPVMALMAKYAWYLLLALLTGYLGWRVLSMAWRAQVDYKANQRAKRAALIERADAEFRLAQAGDLRGFYGDYWPAPGLSIIDLDKEHE